MCLKCGLCCKYLFFECNNLSDDSKILMELRQSYSKFAAYTTVKLFDNVLAVYAPCQLLDLDTNECLDYKNRPSVCRSFNCRKFKYGRLLKKFL
jgi:Fe-S-cluster containining protein